MTKEPFDNVNCSWMQKFDWEFLGNISFLSIIESTGYYTS